VRRLIADGPDPARLHARALAARHARSLGVLPPQGAHAASDVRDAASDALLAIQARTQGGEPGQLALAGEEGALSLTGDRDRDRS
jgi:hypothetical protein